LNAIESLSERIVEYNQPIENLAQQSYPQVALLKQIKGVGTLMLAQLVRAPAQPTVYPSVPPVFFSAT
jgi:hypothetical protein